MLKIAIVTSFYASTILEGVDAKKTGFLNRHPQPWITNLAEALTKKGNDIHVVTISTEFNQDIKFEKNNVDYVFLKSTLKARRTLSLYESDNLRVRHFLKNEGFDIVHGQGMNMFGYYAVTSNIPHVLTIHLYPSVRDRLKEVNGIGFKQIYFMLLSVLMERKTLKRAEQIISISHAVREILVRKGLQAKIYDIENPVHLDFFSKEHSLIEDFCLYVGSITERKNVLVLVKALEKVKRGKIKIIFQAVSGEYYSQVKHYVQENKLDHRVEFLGPKKNLEIVDYLRRALFLVLPSKKEMAPMVISEAMAAGKTVVATAVDGVPYMIRDGETGFLVKSEDVEDLAAKMQLLFNNRSLAQSMGEKAREEALMRWHPDVVAGKTLEVYRKILSFGSKRD